MLDHFYFKGPAEFEFLCKFFVFPCFALPCGTKWTLLFGLFVLFQKTVLLAIWAHRYVYRLILYYLRSVDDHWFPTLAQNGLHIVKNIYLSHQASKMDTKSRNHNPSSQHILSQLWILLSYIYITFFAVSSMKLN